MKTCPDERELARALSDGPGPALEAHLATCAACRASWDHFRALIEDARRLPVDVPSAARCEEIRTAVLASTRAAPPRAAAWRARLAVGVALAAAAAIAFVALRSDPERGSALSPPATAHGTVRAEPTARFALSSPAPDEIVRLEDGRLDIEVSPLAPGERFRVIVGDAEIEVRGTAFEVTAHADRLVAVAVRRGRVELRGSGAPMLLGPGESWQAPLAAAAPPPAAPAPAAAPVSPTAAAATAPAPASAVPGARTERRPPPPPPSELTAAPRPAPGAARPAEELAYDDAWAAMRAQDFARAARLFAQVLAASPAGPLADDAAFWQAVALARGKRAPAAITAFRELLDAHPASPRAGEASAMLGWLLVDRGELDEAARRFHAAERDPDPAVAGSARAGLDALSHR